MISRRDLITAAPAAAAVASIPEATLAAPSSPPSDPDFAVKLEAYRKAEEALRIKHEEIERLREAMPPQNALPEELMQPFMHPTEPGVLNAPLGGWTRDTLRAIARNEAGDHTELHWMRTEPIWSPIRFKAANLLRVRLEYDLACARWRDACDDLSESSAPLSGELNARILEVLTHPVFTFPELAAKVDIAKAEQIVHFVDGVDEIDAIFDDILRMAALRGGL